MYQEHGHSAHIWYHLVLYMPIQYHPVLYTQSACVQDEVSAGSTGEAFFGKDAEHWADCKCAQPCHPPQSAIHRLSVRAAPINDVFVYSSIIYLRPSPAKDAVHTTQFGSSIRAFIL